MGNTPRESAADLNEFAGVRFATGNARDALISVVIPAHNEETGIGGTAEVIKRVMGECGVRWELIVVDDGSRDGTFSIVSAMASGDERIRGLRFSRNFGKEAALLAGINAATGDAVITMDADLQHPPSLIPQMLEAWSNGAKVVHARKRHREHDGVIMRVRATLFNSVISWLGGIDVQNSSDFKLMDRAVVDIIARQMPERRRFFRGLADWVGYTSVEIPFDVAERNAGTGKWSVFGLIELALTALVSFTSAPLRLVTMMGVLTLALGVGVGAEALWGWLHGNAVSGFATTILTLLIIGSFIMISLGIMGEYIAKIYEEVKARPVYLIEESANINADTEKFSR